MNSHSPFCDVSRNGIVNLNPQFSVCKKVPNPLGNGGFTSTALSLCGSVCGWIVLNALEKSKKRT